MEKSLFKDVLLWHLLNFALLRIKRTIFIDNNGLDLLLGLLGSTSIKQQLDGSVALYKLANKVMSPSPMDATPPSLTPHLYLGDQYVNSSTLSYVAFLAEGKHFYTHRIALLVSLDAFHAMFDGGYREKDVRDIEIPNIRWEVFEMMMRYIYIGLVDVTRDIAQDLLRAVDQYLLHGLKRLCEYVIAQDINLENIPGMYEISESFNAMSLRHTYVLFVLEQFDKTSTRPVHGGSFVTQASGGETARAQHKAKGTALGASIEPQATEGVNASRILCLADSSIPSIVSEPVRVARSPVVCSPDDRLCIADMKRSKHNKRGNVKKGVSVCDDVITSQCRGGAECFISDWEEVYCGQDWMGMDNWGDSDREQEVGDLMKCIFACEKDSSAQGFYKK